MPMDVARDFPRPIAFYYDQFRRARRKKSWDRATSLLHMLHEAVLHYLAMVAVSAYLEGQDPDRALDRILQERLVLARAEERHGSGPVNDLLGLILVSGGLADEELRDLLELPRRDRMVLLGTLKPYLVMRDSPLGFFHKKFAETVRERFDPEELQGLAARFADLLEDRRTGIPTVAGSSLRSTDTSIG